MDINDINEIIKKANSCLIKGWKFNALQDTVLNCGQAIYIYYFARGAKKANISKLEDAIIKCGNGEYIYYFARDVQGANITKLENALIRCGDAQDIYLFTRYVKGADLAELWRAMQATNDDYWINAFKFNILAKHPEILEAEEYQHIRDTDDEPLEFIDLD